MTASAWVAGVPVVINDNGAWCWFQDERALVDAHAGLLLVGSVASPGGAAGAERSGTVELTALDLTTGACTTRALHQRLEADDHDAPAIYIRGDGRYLAMYAKHKSDDVSRWRLSTRPHDVGEWRAERNFDWSGLTGGHGVTYSNLHRLSDEGRVYNFVRAVNDDPCVLVSIDDGATFDYAGKLFTEPKIGYVNGYTRYASNGVDRIDLITTDHHPRDYNNSIYHGYVSGGRLFAADGRVVDDALFASDGVSQTRLTTVFAAGTVMCGDILTHAWTVDVRGADGALAAILSCRANDVTGAGAGGAPLAHDDHRLLYARFCDGEWRVHPLAAAGQALLPHEQDYTGLGAVDPYDIDHVYVSTSIDPASGRSTQHHEIYEGRGAGGGAAWTWTAVTENSSVDNLRPIVAPGDPSRHVLLWLRGTMRSSQDFDIEVVAHVRPNE